MSGPSGPRPHPLLSTVRRGWEGATGRGRGGGGELGGCAPAPGSVLRRAAIRWSGEEVAAAISGRLNVGHLRAPAGGGAGFNQGSRRRTEGRIGASAPREARRAGGRTRCGRQRAVGGGKKFGDGVWDDGEWRATCTDEEASQTARRGGGLGQRSTGSCAGGLVGEVHGRIERSGLFVAVPRGSLGAEGAGGAARADDFAGLELEGLDEGEEAAAQWAPKGGGPGGVIGLDWMEM